ncbi:hypothetical protein VTN02DRAFT_1015 [Thermoascus thermophilus]
MLPPSRFICSFFLTHNNLTLDGRRVGIPKKKKPKKNKIERPYIILMSHCHVCGSGGNKKKASNGVLIDHAWMMYLYMSGEQAG